MISDIRGWGLLIGVELTEACGVMAGEVVGKAMEKVRSYRNLSSPNYSLKLINTHIIFSNAGLAAGPSRVEGSEVCAAFEC